MGSDSELREALARLDLRDIARAAGVDLRPPRGEARAGVRCWSPFRPDGKTPGFLLVAAGKQRGGRVVGARDLSTGERWGLWQFAQAVQPGLGHEALVEWLCGLAGVPVRAERRRLTPAERRALEAQRAKAEAKALRRAQDGIFGEACPPPLELVPIPEEVRRRYVYHCNGTTTTELETVAAERGWPVEWPVEANLRKVLARLPTPWDRGCGWAFPVVAPPLEVGGRGRWVGYHQRVTLGVRKTWLYCPYVPRDEGMDTEGRTCAKRLTPYQEVLRGLGLRAPALPFWVGDPWRSQRWLLTEGQWDALTLWGLLREAGLHGKCCVIGLRGAGSIGPLWSEWEPILRERKAQGAVPTLTVFRDADQAGTALSRRDARGRPTLVARWARLFFDDQVRIHVPDTGKDVNDWYRAGGLSPALLATLL